MLQKTPTKSAHAVVMIFAAPNDVAHALRALADQLDRQGVINQVLTQPITDGKRTGNFMVTGDGGAYASITIVLEA